jgi:hypothetical protein
MSAEEFEKETIDFLENELSAMKEREREITDSIIKLQDFSHNCI